MKKVIRAETGAGPDQAIQEAEQLRQHGQYGEARTVLRDALTKLPRSRQADAMRGAILNSLGSVTQDTGSFAVAEHYYL